MVCEDVDESLTSQKREGRRKDLRVRRSIYALALAIVVLDAIVLLKRHSQPRHSD